MFKLLRFLGIFLMVTSGVSYAMEPSSSDETDFKKSILKQAISFCNQYIDFETDNYEYNIANYKEKNDSSKENKKNFFTRDNLLVASINNINVFEVLKKQLEDEKKFHAETFLSTLLDIRFSFLAFRENLITQFQEDMMKNIGNSKWRTKFVYGATKPDLFSDLTPEMQRLARQSTDRYQSYNRLILLIWKLVDPRTLGAQTKLKVRCSTTLWDNLTGKREYLGHPDEAILEYDDSVLPHGLDIVNYDNYLNLYEVEIDPLGWAKSQMEKDCFDAQIKKKMTIWRTVYEMSLWDEKKDFYNKIPEAPYPDWLRPYPKLESTLAKAPFLKTPKKKSTEPSLAKRKKIAHKKKDHKVKPPFSEPKPPMESEEEKLNNQIPPVEITPPMLKAEEKKIEPVSTVKTIPSTILESESDEEESSMEIEEVSNDPSSIDEGVESLNDYVRPTGMRRFHARSQQKMELKAENRIILKGSHLSIRDQIFNFQQFQNVSFGQFKALWKHVSGEKSVIESTGSSHKKLIGPDGDVFGTFAHGDAMTYGPRTIKYIRDALIQIGYGPSEG